MFFQKDYWKMTDMQLEEVAIKYHIGAAVLGPSPYYDRKYAIDCLLARDQAMRTAVTVVATLVSIGSMVINLALLFVRHSP
jgi:hypothetical protein